MNTQPSSTSSRRWARCRSRCSIFAVKSKLTSWNSAWSARELERVGRAVQEVRIAEGDVPGSRRHLLADIGHDHGGGHGEEAAAVHGRDGAVTAKVQAATARLDVAHRLMTSVTLEMGIALERRELRAA